MNNFYEPVSVLQDYLTWNFKKISRIKISFRILSRIPPQCKFTYAKDENSVLFSVSKMCVVCTVHTYIFFFVIEFMRKWQVAVVLLKLEISTEYRWKFPAPKLNIFKMQIKVKVFLVALFSASNLINFWLKIGMKQFKYLNRKSDRFLLGKHSSLLFNNCMNWLTGHVDISYNSLIESVKYSLN